MLVGEDYVYQTSTVTDEFGEYCFLGLNPYKTYAVYEDLDDDWIEVIYEHEGLVFTSSGQELNTGTSFLNAEEVSICGFKYEDSDLSGTIDADDGVLEGWGVDLYMLVGEDYVYQTSTVTDEFGEYCFLGLNPYKTYAVYEDLDDDWIEVIYEHEGLVFTSSGQELNTGTSFLNAEEVSICGFKYEDSDLSGTIDADDGVLEGWGVDLYMLVGEDYVYQTSTVTDEFGEYCFLTPTRHTRYTRTSMTTGSK